MKNIIVSALFLSALTAVPALASDLSGDEIAALVSGKTATWKSANGKVSGTIKWLADGSQELTMKGGPIDADTGKWSVKDGKMCSSWSKIRNGAEQCDAWELVEGKTYKAGSNIVILD